MFVFTCLARGSSLIDGDCWDYIQFETMKIPQVVTQISFSSLVEVEEIK